MTKWRLCVYLLAALLIAVAGADRASPATVQNPAEQLDSRQILVMLEMPPAHYRPNSGYGGDYGDTAGLAARRRVAQGIARRNGLEVVDNWPMPLLGVDCFVMRVPDGISIESAIVEVSKDRLVAWSQPMNVYFSRAAGRQADPLLPVQPAASKWRLSELHQVATGRGVTVAVIDSKVETHHPDLTGQFVADRNFVAARAAAPEKHGTGIAGVIGAKTGNGVGIAGVAPEARIMALRACRQVQRTSRAGGTTCDTLSLAKALHYAIERRAQVINLSLSGPPDRLLQRLVGLALERRTAVVAAFDPDLPAGGFPASQPGVIAVADDSLRPVPSSVYRAPGKDVPTTQPGGKWSLVNGSSYAAAHVSGLMALVRERQGPKARAALARLPQGGAVDACATVLRGSRDCDCPCGSLRQVANGR